MAILQFSAFFTKNYILPSFLKISFVDCHWRTMLLIYLKYLYLITTSTQTHILAGAHKVYF